jgi:4-hydroxybenzoate polyprenyltransferase
LMDPRPSLDVERLLKKADSVRRNARISHWRAYFSIAAMGFILNVPSLSSLTPSSVLHFVFTISLFLGFAFSINNCYDVEADRNNRGKHGGNPMVSGELTVREGVAASLLISALGLVAAFLIYDRVTFLFYLALVTISHAYSSPPIRLKSRPIMDIVSHGLFFGVLPFIFGARATGAPQPQGHLFLASLFASSVILEMRNHVEDIEYDLDAGVNTTATWLGEPQSRRLILAMVGLNIAGELAVLAVIDWTLSLLLVATSAVLFTGLRKLTDREYLFFDTVTVTYYLIFLVFKVAPLWAPIE